MLAGTTAYATGSQIQSGPAPKWTIQSEPMPVPADAAGAISIRRQDTEVHLDDKGQLLYNGYPPHARGGGETGTTAGIRQQT